MTKYDTIKFLSDSNFRSLTGVKRTTFEARLSVLSTKIAKNKKIKGRPSVLTDVD